MLDTSDSIVGAHFDVINQKAIGNLLDWMIDGARPSASAKEIIDAIRKGWLRPVCRSTDSPYSSARSIPTSWGGASGPGRQPGFQGFSRIAADLH
jgi:hypothetical protein